MTKSKIEWTDRVWNPVRGCSRVSEGCRNCYAERQASRFAGTGAPPAFAHLAPPASRKNGSPFAGFVQGGKWTGRVELIADKLDEPLRWRKPARVFVNSMSDLFHEKLSVPDIAAVFGVMAACPQHTFQILTKRPAYMLAWMREATSHHEPRGLDPMITLTTEAQSRGVEMDDRALETRWPLPNVWLGVSVEDQKTADERIPILLRTPAAVRFVSYEPALGPVDFAKWLVPAMIPCWERGYEPTARDFAAVRDVARAAMRSVGHHLLDWVITGGESGPGARPAHRDWFRSARDQCQAAGVPFFFKQWGEWAPNWYTNKDGSEQVGTMWVDKIGKKRASRLLDGREWNEFPEARP